MHIYALLLYASLVCFTGCLEDHGPPGNGVMADGAVPDAAKPDGDDPARGDDGGSGGPSTLYPLEVGYRWTYDVKTVGGGSICAAGEHSSQVLNEKPLDGKQAFEVTSFCNAIGNSFMAAKGEEAFSYYSGHWLTLIAEPLQEGASWPYYNTSYTWHRETSVTVPAGTFTDCWTAKQNVSYMAYSTYCRGVGLVRSYSQDLTGAGWDAALLSKSF